MSDDKCTPSPSSWDVEDWREQGPMCTRCHVTIGWEGDDPEHGEDAICDTCAWSELQVLRGKQRMGQPQVKYLDEVWLVFRDFGYSDESFVEAFVSQETADAYIEQQGEKRRYRAEHVNVRGLRTEQGSHTIVVGGFGDEPARDVVVGPASGPVAPVPSAGEGAAGVDASPVLPSSDALLAVVEAAEYLVDCSAKTLRHGRASMPLIKLSKAVRAMRDEGEQPSANGMTACAHPKDELQDINGYDERKAWWCSLCGALQWAYVSDVPEADQWCLPQRAQPLADATYAMSGKAFERWMRGEGPELDAILDRIAEASDPNYGFQIGTKSWRDAVIAALRTPQGKDEK